VGNLASILLPYRVGAGSLKPTKTKATTMVGIVFVQMLFPLAICPLALPTGLGLLFEHFGWLPAAAVDLALSGLACLAAGLCYWGTLAALGRLLQQREQKILQAVTQEVE
jgi:hypothetical protein